MTPGLEKVLSGEISPVNQNFWLGKRISDPFKFDFKSHENHICGEDFFLTF